MQDVTCFREMQFRPLHLTNSFTSSSSIEQYKGSSVGQDAIERSPASRTRDQGAGVRVLDQIHQVVQMEQANIIRRTYNSWLSEAILMNKSILPHARYTPQPSTCIETATNFLSWVEKCRLAQHRSSTIAPHIPPSSSGPPSKDSSRAARKPSI